jgi:hypothetical protein
MNTTLRPFVTILSFLLLSASAHAAKLILNEYNAVSSENFLNGGDEFQDGDGNIPPPADAFFGRVVGNGGDWFELVVVADHLDIRGWRLAIVDDDVPESPLVFSNSAIWANLRAGTIITVSEDVPDDVSYSPAAGDWWINVRAADPADGGTGTYITASNFPTSNDTGSSRSWTAITGSFSVPSAKASSTTTAFRRHRHWQRRDLQPPGHAVRDHRALLVLLLRRRGLELRARERAGNGHRAELRRAATRTPLAGSRWRRHRRRRRPLRYRRR